MFRNPIFTSTREQRIWLWTLVVVIGIYSTLGLAQKLAGVLRENGLLESSLIFGMLLIGVTILIQGLKTHPGRVDWPPRRKHPGVSASPSFRYSRYWLQRLGSPHGNHSKFNPGSDAVVGDQTRWMNHHLSILSRNF